MAKESLLSKVKVKYEYNQTDASVRKWIKSILKIKRKG